MEIEKELQVYKSSMIKIIYEGKIKIEYVRNFNLDLCFLFTKKNLSLNNFKDKINSKMITT